MKIDDTVYDRVLQQSRVDRLICSVRLREGGDVVGMAWNGKKDIFAKSGTSSYYFTNLETLSVKKWLASVY